MRLIYRILVGLTFLSLSLLACELLSRAAYYFMRGTTVSSTREIVSDSQLGWKLNPKRIQLKYKSACGEEVVLEPPPSELLVKKPKYPSAPTTALFLGDSFTYANTVSTGKAYYDVVEELAAGNLRVFASGVVGYNHAQEYLALKAIAPEIKPDIIFWQMCNNDVEEGVFNGKDPKSVQMPRTYLDPTTNTFFSRNPGFTLLEYSHLARFAYARIGELDYRFKLGIIDWLARVTSKGLSKLQIEEGSRAVLGSVLTKAKAEFPHSRIIGFNVVSEHDEIYSAVFKSAGVEYISDFADILKRDGRKTDCLPVDAHWNLLGNELAGNALASYLKSVSPTRASVPHEEGDFALGAPAPSLAKVENKPKSTNAAQIKIGAALYLTSDVAPQAEAFREGLELGVAGSNAQLVLDSVRSPRDSVLAISKMISVDGINAAVVNGQPDAIPLAPIVEKAKVPTFSLWDASEDIDASGRFIFSLGLWTKYSGVVAAEFARKELKASTAAVVAPQDVWSKTVADAFETRFKELGGEIIYSARTNPEESNYLDFLTKVRLTKPDIIYETIYLNIHSFFQRMRKGGVAIPIITADVLSDQIIMENPELFVNSYQTAVPFPSGGRFTELQSLYRQRYNKEMLFPWFTAVAFDVVTLIREASTAVGNDAEKMAAWMYSVKDFPGASNIISISPTGSSPQHPMMYRVHDGKLKLISSK